MFSLTYEVDLQFIYYLSYIITIHIFVYMEKYQVQGGALSILWDTKMNQTQTVLEILID